MTDKAYSSKIQQKTDFFVGDKGKVIKAALKEWIGDSRREEFLSTASNSILANAVNELYRSGAFIGDGGTAAALRFENATGLMLGKKGNHRQKCEDMLSYLERKVAIQNLNEKEKRLTKLLIEDLKEALAGR